MDGRYEDGRYESGCTGRPSACIISVSSSASDASEEEDGLEDSWLRPSSAAEPLVGRAGHVVGSSMCARGDEICSFMIAGIASSSAASAWFEAVHVSNVVELRTLPDSAGSTAFNATARPSPSFFDRLEFFFVCRTILYPVVVAETENVISGNSMSVVWR